MAGKTNARFASVPGAKHVPVDVEELKPFTREARKVLSLEELKQLRLEVAQMRELGAVVMGTGGLRKIRWQLDNAKGKSGGARVLYYYGGDDVPLYLIAFYEKSKKADLTAAEKRAVKKFIQGLKTAQRKARQPRLQLVKA